MSARTPRREVPCCCGPTLTLLAERHAPDAVSAEVARHFDASEIAELTLDESSVWRLEYGLAS